MTIFMITHDIKESFQLGTRLLDSTRCATIRRRRRPTAPA